MLAFKARENKKLGKGRGNFYGNKREDVKYIYGS